MTISISASPLRHRRAVAARRRGVFGGVPSARSIPPGSEPPKDRARSLRKPALGGAATPHELRVLPGRGACAKQPCVRAAHLHCDASTESRTSGAHLPRRRPPALTRARASTLPSACQWAARGAAAASTRGGATARRPAACCPSRLYWVTGTGTTAARTGTTASSSDCGASPSTRTATLLSCSSRIIGGDGSRLPSLLC